MTLTKAGNYAVAIIMIFIGMALDHSQAIGFEGLHHAAFIAAGVFLGFGIRKES